MMYAYGVCKYYHIHLNVCFHAWISWTVSVYSYTLASFPFSKPFLITSFHVFLGHPLRKLRPTLYDLYLTDQALSLILSR